VLKKAPALYLAALAAGLSAQLIMSPAVADGFGPMNMMNPGKWFGGNDRYGRDDDYPPPPPMGYGAPYGAPLPYGGAPGYASPMPGGAYAPAPGYYQGYAPAGSVNRPLGAPVSQGYQTPSYNTQTPSGPSRAEMEDRIQELELRLQDMEAKAQAATHAPQPTSPPPTSYQYYSGDQTPSPSYPFRPMDLGK
jgi:hypothetical protein